MIFSHQMKTKEQIEKKRDCKKPTVIELCCGMGGARKAFFDAGFDVIQSIDSDEKVVEFHKLFWGDATHLDINECSLDQIFDADILSAGFPCQPFSTSGYRTGFDHNQGNVFLSILNLIDAKNFNAVFLENVTGLLSNDEGHTFKEIISELSKRYGTVEWLTYNLLSLGIPMNRPRLVIIGHDHPTLLLKEIEREFFVPSNLDLFPEEKEIEVAKFLKDKSPNQPSGVIKNGLYFEEEKSPKTIRFKGDLMNFLFDEKIGEFQIFSGRFWGRTGKTTFYVSTNQFSHSIGTSMGGAPTFGFDPMHLNDKVIDKVKKIANYTTEHSGIFVFRLKPEIALGFFGDRATIFDKTISEIKIPLATKYKLIGNMFAPDQALVAISCLRNIFKT
jgi:DNA-cytosine methyltransferase